MSNDLADPTDWITTKVPALQALENSLHCQVCKEFFTAPVITSCGHTFCSLCIRRCLTDTRQCPTCRTTDEESKLRKNTSVQELLDNFLKVRGSLLESLKVVDVVEDVNNVEEKRGEKRGSVSEDDEEYQERTRKGKRRRQEGPSKALKESSSGSITRISRRSSRQRAPVSSQMEYMVISDDEDDDFAPQEDESEVEDPKPLSRRSKTRFDTPKEPLVECPSCQRLMTAKQVELHVNRCLDGDKDYMPPATPNRQNGVLSPVKKPPPTFSNKPVITRPPYTPKEQAELRLAKVNYHITKDKPLKTKLAEFGIKTTGTRQELEKRHQEWINVWNSNLDSATPKTKEQLRSELEEWERRQSKAQPNFVKDKAFDGDKWAKSNKDGFDDLIKKARENSKKKKENDAPKADESKETLPDSSVGGSVPVVVNGIDSSPV